MKINEELIEQVADVARLNLTKKEKEQFVDDFNEILAAFSALDEVDTKGTNPSFQPVEIKNKLREDKAEKSFSQEDALANSQNKKDGYFKGPRAT